MSRRTGPGGRLRPAPRPHRPTGARLDIASPTVPRLDIASPTVPPRMGALAARIDARAALEPERSALLDGLIDTEPEMFEASASEPVPDDSTGDATAGGAVTIELAEGAQSAVGTRSGQDSGLDGRAHHHLDPGHVAPNVQTAASEPAHANGAAARSHELDTRRPRPRPEHRAPVFGANAAADHARTDGSPHERSDDPACTAPQLRRFIKSRSYVPLHELRRRFAIDGEDDDVSALDVPAGRVFVGLPNYASRLLSDLVRNGEIGYELSMDPETPIVVGVYAMRPISRT